MSQDATLELVALTKRYGDALAVHRIDLKVASGAYCCLLGPSGCGKSTTLRMIAGHESASDGDVMLGGAMGGMGGGIGTTFHTANERRSTPK